MEHADLLTKVKSNNFTIFECIENLKIYGNNIGIHHFLVKKLRSFTYDEVEFFIPQFIQLIVVFETDSMALEDFLIDYSAKYPHFCLTVFWNLQAYIFELRNDPDSYSFQVVRRFVNTLQNIMFTVNVLRKAEEFRENFQPSVILSGAIAMSIALPRVNEYILPLIKSQAKQQKSFVFKLANFQKSLTKNLTLKNKQISADATSLSDDERVAPRKPQQVQRSLSVPRNPRRSTQSILSDESEPYTTDDEEAKSSFEKNSFEIRREPAWPRPSQVNYSKVEENLRIHTIIKSKKSLRKAEEGNVANVASEYAANSHSLPDLSKLEIKPYFNDSEYSLSSNPTSARRSLQIPAAELTTYEELLKSLQVTYAKKETQFIMSLQNISLRLGQVPKEARLSALRAELSIINDTLLPSEIDIPQLFPITSNKNKKYHKMLRLSINEACVLNSAERVPFLLLVEYLSDEFDFNPFSEANQKILSNTTSTTSSRSKDITSSVIDISSNSVRSPSSLNQQNDTLDDFINADEADLSDLPILSTKSSNHDFSKLRDSPKIEMEGKYSPMNLNNVNDLTTKVLADQMRIASVMLQQLENSGQSNSDHFLAIRTRIVESMISLQDQFDYVDYEMLNELKSDLPDAGERKLENDFKLGEDWQTKKQRIRNSSVYGHLPNWDLCSVICKNGDDLPQEAFACQLISMISNIWKKKNIGAWTKRMKILITSSNTGLVETINNAMSIHSIKKSLTEMSISEGANSKGRIFTLRDYFQKIYGSSSSRQYKKAQENFAKSLASYSIICYVLQIKDRHNGNIMIDHEGHIVHIDFGFLLSNSPGSVGFEAAPFKLTSEYVELLDGVNSPLYQHFKDLCKRCFNALRKESDHIVGIVELMQKDSNLPCFKNGENTSILMKQRLQIHLTDEESDQFVETALIARSVGSMYTRLYDQFQMITQGIYS